MKKKNKQQILKDIRYIQLSHSKTVFDTTCDLFIKKWEKEEKDFCDYFRKQWLDVHCNWYEGAAEYSPSTNNNLEAYNGVLKSNYTFRNRLEFGVFVETIAGVVRKLSKDYLNENRKVSTVPSISTALWRKSVDWVSNSDLINADLVKVQSNDSTLKYFIRSDKFENVEKRRFNFEYCKKVLETQWKTFDDYEKFGFQTFYEVIVRKNEENESTDNWKIHSKCTCVEFMKTFICSHIIGIALLEKICKCPKFAITTPLGEKAKRGRKRKASQALMRN